MPVTVTISPPAAVAAGAMWTMDGGTPMASGSTVLVSATSYYYTTPHVVGFVQVPGYSIPNTVPVAPLEGGTAVSVSGTYGAPSSCISATITPAQAAVTGATWNVDGGPAQPSGATVDVLAGSHFIHYTTGNGSSEVSAYSGTLAVVTSTGETLTTTGTLNVSGTTAGYQSGSLTVTMDAGSVAAGATWNVDGAAAQVSGATYSGLAVGPHTVNFLAATGYSPPASETVTIAAGETTTASGTYTPDGSVTTSITPAGAATAGAEWNVDGGSWQTAGATAANIAPGSHVVNFSAASGYGAPASQSITVGSGSTASTSGTYSTQSGAISVTVSPSGTGGWYVDGGTVQTSGATVSGLAPGTHSVTFAPAGNNTTPAGQSVTVIAGGTATLTGTYVYTESQLTLLDSFDSGTGYFGSWYTIDGGSTTESFNNPVILSSPGTHTINVGSTDAVATPSQFTVLAPPAQSVEFALSFRGSTGFVNVSVLPQAAVTAGAAFRLNGGAWESASTNSGGAMPIGSYTIDFEPIAGWTTPASVTENIDAGSGNTAYVTGTYTPAAGYLLVNLTPAGAVSAGAGWNLDGGTAQVSGALLSNVSTGTHTVNFLAATGYVTPASQTVTISSSSTTITTGTYTQTGAVNVTLSPAGAVTAGAEWNLDGGAGQVSGATVTGLSPGSHTVNFISATGWAAPASQVVTVANNATTYASGTFAQTGSVSATLTPAEAVSAGALWNVDGGTNQASGATVANLAPGSHTVNFIAATGYFAPASQNVTVSSGVTTSVTGTYTQPGSVTVNIAPGGAAAGAYWIVDSSAPQASGATVTGLTLGNHDVYFTAVSGYQAPGSQSFSIASGQAVTLTGTYVPAAAPSITSGTSDAAVVGQRYSYQITATNLPTSFGAPVLPAWLGVTAGSGVVSGTPTGTGTFPLTVTASNAYGTGTGNVQLVVRTPLGAWQCGMFGAETATDAGVTMVNNVAGITNLTAYGLGLNPFTAQTNELPSAGMMGAHGSQYLALYFTRNTGATDLTYTVEGTDALSGTSVWAPVSVWSSGAGWSPAGNVVESGTGPNVDVWVLDSQSVGGSAARFLRLRITY